MKDSRITYREHVASLTAEHDAKRAMELAVGGEFEAFGILQRECLIQYGLRPNDYVIDVGCGSGRLAKPLSEYLTGPYLGTDVVPELVDYARELVARPDWRFVVVDGFTIPERDGIADFVCFFSVFTHILHQQSYMYLQEAKRVLNSGGKVVFSFLEFRIPCHWTVFENSVAKAGTDWHLDQFIERNAIHAWASHLGFTVEAIEDGDKPHIPLRQRVVRENGEVLEHKGTFGQSVCVLISNWPP